MGKAEHYRAPHCHMTGKKKKINPLEIMNIINKILYYIVSKFPAFNSEKPYMSYFSEVC